MTDSTLCVIGARGGSKGVPGKNVRPIAGTTLIGITVDQALRVFGSVVVSTDDDQIAAVAREHGAMVPFTRPGHLATDDAPKIPVLRHAADWVEGEKGQRFDLVVDLSCTTPLRSDDDIAGAIELFHASGDIDNVISICSSAGNPFFNQVLMTDDGAIRLVMKADDPPSSRQAAPPVYIINGAVYVWRRDALATGDRVVRERSVGYVMPSERSLDIDTELDFKLAQLILESH